jgi:hypothetical protein
MPSSKHIFPQDVLWRFVITWLINHILLTNSDKNLGSDTSWATPVTTHTYFRNVQLWGSSAASNFTGQSNNDAPSTIKFSSMALVFALLAVVAGSVFCV